VQNRGSLHECCGARAHEEFVVDHYISPDN